MNLASNIEISVNDELIKIPRAISLETFLLLRKIEATRGIAVAVNGVVIKKSDWNSTMLHENDAVLLITATQGG